LFSSDVHGLDWTDAIQQLHGVRRELDTAAFPGAQHALFLKAAKMAGIVFKPGDEQAVRSNPPLPFHSLVYC
jgi:hypothetical protein